MPQRKVGAYRLKSINEHTYLTKYHHSRPQVGQRWNAINVRWLSSNDENGETRNHAAHQNEGTLI